MALGRVTDNESGRMTIVERINYLYYEVLIRIYIFVFRCISFIHQVCLCFTPTL